MATKLRPISPEDRLSLVEHLDELRKRLIVCVVVFAGWVGYCVMILAAAQGLTRSLMQAMFGVDAFAHWEPSEVFVIAGEDVTDALLATVLGFMGLFLWLGAIGFLLVMLTRAGALLVLVAVSSRRDARHRGTQPLTPERATPSMM